jgi:hypothetical protein
MGKKKKPSSKVPSWVDIFKSQRGEPIPPKRVVPMKNRELEDEAAQEEIDEALYDSYEDEDD